MFVAGHGHRADAGGDGESGKGSCGLLAVRVQTGALHVIERVTARAAAFRTACLAVGVRYAVRPESSRRTVGSPSHTGLHLRDGCRWRGQGAQSVGIP